MGNEFRVKHGLIVNSQLTGSTVLDIRGTQGQLISVEDSVTGSIFNVYNSTGTPILNINNNGEINVCGNLITSGNLSGTTTNSICLNGQPANYYALATHTHGNINNCGCVGNISGCVLLTCTDGCVYAGSPTSIGAIQTVNNGLTKTGTNVHLGGVLTGDTNIGGNYTLSICNGSKLNTACGYQISGNTILNINPINQNQINIGSTSAYGEIKLNGNVGINVDNTLGILHISSGSTTTPPILLNSGNLLSTTKAGALEFDGNHIYFSRINSGNRRALDDDRKLLEVKVNNDSTYLTTGSSKIKISMPYEINGYSLIRAEASVSTPSTGETPTINIYNYTDNISMLLTPITIDVNQYTSYNAAIPSVVNPATNIVTTGDMIGVDVSTSGDSAKGLAVILTFDLL